jgi:hypothetical protein
MQLVAMVQLQLQLTTACNDSDSPFRTYNFVLQTVLALGDRYLCMPLFSELNMSRVPSVPPWELAVRDETWAVSRHGELTPADTVEAYFSQTWDQ